MLDVPGLERLLGGDTEAEIGLRRGVVENFARQKLASLFDHPEMQGVLRDLAEHAKREVGRRIAERVPQPYPKAATWRIAPDVQAALNDAIQEAVEANVNRATADIEARINEAVERKVLGIQREAIRRVEKAVGDRWTRDVNEEVQRIIGAAYTASQADAAPAV